MKDKNFPLPLGCVVIPCHNKAATIKRSIDSVKEQPLNNLECIIVDDSSSDNSKDVILAAIADDKRFRYERVEFGNVALTRNYGIGLSDAPYISALDGDDWLEPSFIEKCVKELEQDRTIGIAYTGLRWHNPQNGESKVSDWPGAYMAAKQFDYEARQNQIPTCCVFRRDAWDRVGGFRSRYCPDGAGSEDAAFWSQILSIGYTAKQVTPKPLFNYSLGGQVSADTDYHEIDWLAWLPFSRDKRYPFACSVLPQRFSHPVRQYDEPELSIVIPVGPGHEGDLRTALDSIEAQHFRDWETIAVLDTGNEYYPDLYKAYPHVKWGITDGKRGAGYARNQGAEMAKGKFLFFLDADDFLNPAEPHALGEMIAKFWETGNGIYSAHIGRAIVSSAYAEKMQRENRLAAWNEKLGQAYISNPGIDYNCEQAVAEPRDHPDGKFYIWNLISTLIPRQWHFDIGGFDENMKTWEDWDYWLRMAKAGRCFTRIPKPYIIYNYISGTRRELGLQKGNEVLQYLKTKHDRIEIAMCGCGASKKAGETMTEAEGYVMATYISRNVGRHDIGFGLGRHVGGGAETFLVPEQIAKSNPQLFKIAEEIVADPSPAPEQMAAPTPIYSADGGFSWTEDELIDVSTLSPFLQQQLKEVDLISKEAIRAAGVEALKRLKGVGEATAKKIMELAE